MNTGLSSFFLFHETSFDLTIFQKSAGMAGIKEQAKMYRSNEPLICSKTEILPPLDFGGLRPLFYDLNRIFTIDLVIGRRYSWLACFATHVLASGAEPTQVMKMGGWSDFKTFQIYVRMAGVDVKGVTDDFRVTPKLKLADNVIEFNK